MGEEVMKMTDPTHALVVVVVVTSAPPAAAQDATTAEEHDRAVFEALRNAGRHRRSRPRR
jgi:hypothetical protein